MVKRLLLASFSILLAWTAVDAGLHRFVLARFYQSSASLWRPFDQLNIALIYVVTLALIGVFVGTYQLLVRPKSLGAGVGLGAFIGLGLGVSAGFGTYIHMPIPPALAWGWFVGGSVKGLAAGALVGALLEDRGSAP